MPDPVSPTPVLLDFDRPTGQPLAGTVTISLETPLFLPETVVPAGVVVQEPVSGVTAKRVMLYPSLPYGVTYRGTYDVQDPLTGESRRVWRGRFQVPVSAVDLRLSQLANLTPVEPEALAVSVRSIADALLVDPIFLAQLASYGGGEGSDLIWATVSGNLTAAPGLGYLVDSLSLVQITLPETAVSGDSFEVYGRGTGPWRLVQQAGQQIFLGDKTTTLGVSGGVRSLARGDWLKLVYLAGAWTGVAMQGNLEVL